MNLSADPRVQIKYQLENLPESLSTIEALVAIAHWFPWPSNIGFSIFHTQILGRAVYNIQHIMLTVTTNSYYKTNMSSVPQMGQGAIIIKTLFPFYVMVFNFHCNILVRIFQQPIQSLMWHFRFFK